MTLSLVIPSLNQGSFIAQTLESLVAQRGLRPGELEVIVVDGGSADETMQVVDRYRRVVTYLVSEPDEGQTDALIKGFKLSSGEVMGWLCADDLLEPNTVREVLDLFAADKTLEFVYGDALWIDVEGRVLKKKKELPFNWFVWLYDYNYIPQPAAFWRRTLYDRVGGLDRRMQLAMDADLWARFALETTPRHVRRCWARMRRYPEQKNQRLRWLSDQEDRIIRRRLGVSYENPLGVLARFCLAKAFRISWKAVRGCYF